MKPLATRQIARRSHPARRYGAALGALALGLGLAGVEPAAADCSGPHLTIHRAHAIDYVCRARCAASAGESRLLLTRDRDGHDASACMSLCDEFVGCRAISFEFITETGSDGRSYQYTQCYIWGEGELATADRDGEASPRARQPGVCYRRWAASRDPRLQIDTRIFDQDSLRPGLPRIGVPYSPGK